MTFPLLPDELAGPVGAWIGTYLVHSTALFVLAWSVARLVRSAAVREQVWRAALFGPLLTASLQVGAGVDPLLGRWDLGSRPAAVAEAPSPATPSLAADPRELALLGAIAQGEARLAALRGAVSPAPEPAAGPWDREGWGRVASLLLALGIAALTLRVALEAVRMGRLGGRTRVRGGALVQEVNALRRTAGLRRTVALETTEGGLSPYATGLLRPRVVVPRRALEELGPARRRAMLAHELGHIARLDPLWTAATRSVSSLLFFQPLNWITARRLEETAEFACDEFAVRLTGDEVALARCLTTVAEWIVGPAAPACPMARKGSKLGERVTRILEADGGPAKGARGARALGAALVVAATGLAPGVAVAATPAQPVVAAVADPAPDLAALPEVFAALEETAVLVVTEVRELRLLTLARDVDPATGARLTDLERRALRLLSVVRAMRASLATR